jgi:hypothetical protein
VVAPDAPERPPGRALGGSGATASVDRIANPDDAYGVSMSAGHTYRVHVVSRERCVSASLYPPGTSSFADGSPVRSFGCDEYFLYTPGPGEGGRYSIQVRAPRSRRGALPYHLQVSPAGEDDTAPGLLLANDVRVRGALRGSGVDVVDLYRFALAERSRLRLRVSGGFRLQLLRDTGARLGTSDEGEIERPVSKGRYFVAVRAVGTASGRYVLQRAARSVTSAGISVNGKRSTQIAPGQTVRIGVRLRPAVAGPVRITIDRFDPLAGWQFDRRVTVRAAGGAATLAFTPPSVGRWRARAEYRGTRLAAPSSTGFAHVLVASSPR